MKKRYIAAALLVAGLSAAYLSLPSGSRSRKTESVAALGKEVGVTFPPSTRLIGVHRESGMDDYVAIKLEMKAADVPTFLASSPIDPTTMTADAVAYFGLDRDFWDPNKAPGFRAAQANPPGTFRTLNLGVSDPRNGVAAVYIVEHGD